MKLKPAYRRPFVAFVKKQHKAFQAIIEDTVKVICNNPASGEPKTGDLTGILVYKFTYQKQEYLIAYHVPEHDNKNKQTKTLQFLSIDFYQIGLHENFYTTLKRYLRESGWYR